VIAAELVGEPADGPGVELRDGGGGAADGEEEGSGAGVMRARG